VSSIQTASQFLLTLGGILLLSIVTSALGRHPFLPRVTLLIILGIMTGQNALNIIPSVFINYFEIIADMALLMVGFLLGGKLTSRDLKELASQALWVSLTAAIGTAICVYMGLVWAGAPKEVAILLGCLAAATDPAAVFDAILENGQQSPFAKLLLSIVALDDAWALILFSVGVSLAASMNGHGGDSPSILIAIKEVFGAVVLGTVIGVPAAYLTGRIKPGEPALSEALGVVFVTGGLALWLDVSFLIASMTMGAVIANTAKHHEYPFHSIEGVEWPFMVIFFVLAGASLDISALKDMGLIGAAYVICRVLGKLCGGYLGGKISHGSLKTQRWVGVALLPQAGIAIGMALVAANHFPEYRQILLSVTISTTVLFEIFGPVFTRIALTRSQ